MQKRVVLVAILAACCVGGVHAASDGQGSGVPTPGPSDVAIAKAKQAFDSGGSESQADSLLSSLRGAPRGDRQWDAAAYEFVRMAASRSGMTEKFFEVCAPDQVLRVMTRLRLNHDFVSQRAVSEEFLKRYPDAPEAGEMMHIAAKSSLIAHGNTEYALALWDRLAKSKPGTPQARAALLYREAVLGPESIAAFEAATEIAWSQSEIMHDYPASFFSHARVVACAEKEFFQEYMASPHVSANDKAEILYKLLYNKYKHGNYEQVPELASRVFGLVGYRGQVSEKAALAVAMSCLMRKQFEDAAARFTEFLRVYPNSADAPSASLHCAYAYDWSGKKAEALLQYGLTAKLYPNSESASEAEGNSKVLIEFDPNGLLLARASKAEPSRLADLRKSIDPATVWPAKALATAGAVPLLQHAAKGTTTTGERFKRMATILNQGADQNTPLGG